jgi:multidrug efflux pump subunit AcrA (membrane-fusion protein)
MLAHTERWRIAIGGAAVAALLLISLVLPRWGGVRDRAVVAAGRTFLLMSPNPGEYTWNLLHALPARNQTPVLHRHVQFDRGDLVELELAPDLATGAAVVPGQQLAVIQSPALVRELNELRAERDVLAAELALLRAGGRPEEVAEAQRRLELAEALRAGELVNLERTRALHQESLASDTDMELAELRDEELRLDVELARAQLAVVRGAARPGVLDALDAQIAVLDAELAELETTAEAYVIRTPISGILEMGGSTNLLRVYDLDTVYLQIPIPQGVRYRVDVGNKVLFRTPACPGKRFEGNIVDLGENAINLNGRQIFWGSARVDNPEHLLRTGMTGSVVIDAEGGSPGLIRSLWRKIVGVGM